METENWFKIKKYPHIGNPIVLKDYKWVKAYVSNKTKIIKHSFLPLIHQCLHTRKYRADKQIFEKNPSGKRKRILLNPKKRDIYYSCHMDAMVFSYYNNILITAYEKYLLNKPYQESIVAYRRIPIRQDSEKNKCNIDFAKDSFNFIKKNNHRKLSVFISDITSFFDNLDHKILKKQWTKMINEKTLPSDHYNVFKGLTRLRYVESDQLFSSCNQIVDVKIGVENNKKRKKIVKKRINEHQFLKEKNAVSYCSKAEFLNNKLNLIISKKKSKGIPQGSPISATLANIYMSEFDSEIHNKIISLNGYYQRYSDDLIMVCDQKNEDELIAFVRDKIVEITKLKIQKEKTNLYHFEKIDGVFIGFEVDENSKEPNFNKTLEYLGFTYDGKRVLIKTAGFSKYYRSMKSSFKKSASLAINGKNKDRKLFKTALYKRFTYKGAKRKLIYRPSISNPNIYEASKEFNWGNYLSYVYKANDTMFSLNRANFIKDQSSKCWTQFHKLISYHEERIKLAVNNKNLKEKNN